MSSEADGRSTYNWTTLRYLVDPRREITVPMGVILWSEDQQRLWFRLPQEDERLPTASGCDALPAARARAYLGDHAQGQHHRPAALRRITAADPPGTPTRGRRP